MLDFFVLILPLIWSHFSVETNIGISEYFPQNIDIHIQFVIISRVQVIFEYIGPNINEYFAEIVGENTQ